MESARLLVLLTLIPCTVSTWVSSEPGPGERLAGAWQLLALEEPNVTGHMHTAMASGLLTLSADGRMAVQVMYLHTASTASPYLQAGYEASFGRYELDPQTHRLSYHVEGALVRTLIGQRQQRNYAVSGNALIITPVDPAEHWRVTWTRS